MFGEFLSEVISNQKLSIVKTASIFAGGILVGYALKKVLDSYDMEDIKNNAQNMFEYNVDSNREYLENLEKEIVDKENDEEE